MQIVRVKPKFQITLPASVRAQAKISIGDILEVRVDRNGVLTLTAKSVIDRRAS